MHKICKALRLTGLICDVDIGLGVDEIVYHSLYRQSDGQHERRCAVVHLRVHFRCTVSQKYLRTSKDSQAFSPRSKVEMRI